MAKQKRPRQAPVLPRMSPGDRMIFLDPSSTAVGFACFDHQAQLTRYGVLRREGGNYRERAVGLARDVDKLIKAEHWDEMRYEKPWGTLWIVMEVTSGQVYRPGQAGTLATLAFAQGVIYAKTLPWCTLREEDAEAARDAVGGDVKFCVIDERDWAPVTTLDPSELAVRIRESNKKRAKAGKPPLKNMPGKSSLSKRERAKRTWKSYRRFGRWAIKNDPGLDASDAVGMGIWYFTEAVKR